MKLTGGRCAGVLTAFLLLQAALYYNAAYRSEVAPEAPPLSSFPTSRAGWRIAQELPLDQENLDVLKADDTLNRTYVDAGHGQGASLFIAFFKTQRYGQAPHSPKNCLPGSGWEAKVSSTLPIAVPGRRALIVVNKYVVEHGSDHSLVLYWYQSRNRVIASEYWAKFWLVADAIRYRRSDTSLVRVVVPMESSDPDRATKTAVDFIQALFPDLLRQFPS